MNHFNAEPEGGYREIIKRKICKNDNETKKKIVKMTFKLIKEHGLDQVTVRDICSASGISKHTLYYYFDSKENILSSFKLVPFELKPDDIVGLISPGCSFEKLCRTLDLFIDFFINLGPEVAKIVLTPENIKELRLNKANYTPDQNLLKIQLTLIDNAKNEGTVRNSSSTACLFNLLHASIFGLLANWIKTNGNFDLKLYARHFAECLLDVTPSERKTPNELEYNFFCPVAEE